MKNYSCFKGISFLYIIISEAQYGEAKLIEAAFDPSNFLQEQSADYSSVGMVDPQVISIDLLQAYERSDNNPEGWTKKDAEIALSRYERFLILAAKYKHLRHAPTRDIDHMWHLHMLNPRAYYADCLRLFGEIFDHDGGFGKGEGELEKLKQVFESTCRLWEIEYQEPYVLKSIDENSFEKCWHDCQGRCWHACSNNSNGNT